MKQTLILSTAALLIGLCLTAPTTNAETFTCNSDPFYSRTGTGVTTVASRLRSQPCMDDSEILTVIPANKEIELLGEMDGWYKVKFGETYGWVGSRLINAGNSTKATTAQEKTETKAATKTVNVLLKDVIGINEANYSLLLNGNPGLLKRLKNKIVMRVHAHGELYQVNTNGLQKVTIKMLEDTTDDSPSTETDKPAETGDTQSDTAKLTLSAKLVNNIAVQLNWTAEGSEFEQGFKVVVSESPNPVYPGNTYHYFSNRNMRMDTWFSGFEAGHTYHFRVCEYLGGSCGAYSNDVSITWPGSTVETPSTSNTDKSISLTVGTYDGKASLNWSVSGFTSEMGFKVVVSENPNPVYPGNDYHYYSESEKRSDTWGGFESGNTYHFRVCEYLGGKCGVYSNDVSWVAP